MVDPDAQRQIINTRIEPHRRVDRLRGKLLCLIAAPTLARALRRRTRVTELWIGDSHAMTMNRAMTNSLFCVGPEGQVILRAGARLMHSLAHQGFPPNILRLARLIGVVGRPGAVVPVFSAGEIDVRVHLAERLDDPLDWVADYVAHCLDLAAGMQARAVGFMVPPAPCDVSPDIVWYPVIGTIEQRVLMHARLRTVLHRSVTEASAVPGAPRLAVIDVTSQTVGPTGATPLELTSDGAHSSLAVLPMVRKAVRASGLTV